MKLLIDIDARGNNLSSCKIPYQYLKNKKVIKLLVCTGRSAVTTIMNMGHPVLMQVNLFKRSFCFLVV